MNLSDILNYILFHLDEMYVSVGHICWLLVFIIGTLVFNLFIQKVALKPYFRYMELDEGSQNRILKLFRNVLICICLFLSFQLLIDQFEFVKKPLFIEWLKNIFAAGSILFGAQLLIWGLNQVLLQSYFKKKEIDVGRQYTITRLILYFGFTIGILLILQVLGVNMSFFIGGSAALLVGVGLGLQQTFNDLISGIIILIEGTVQVGDIVNIDNFIAKVRKIGLRTSEIETRDRSIIIIPNSKLVVENVNNWSHNAVPVRFQIKVGVAYSSDVILVEKILLEAANKHPKVLKNPKPRVQLFDFGNSSFDFLLHFYSNEDMYIEFVKSDIRFNIVALFRQNNVEIPFPQQDIWFRNAEVLKKEKEDL